MAPSKHRSPFDSFRRRLDASDFRCSACGCIDREAEWRATATGSTVSYRRICPGCEAVATRELQLR